MKLTELRDKINEALKIHDDYEVKVNDEEINECGIDSGRFNFNIFVDDQIFNCEEYHIEEDDDMRYCVICDLYHLSEKDCPGCELEELKN